MTSLLSDKKSLVHLHQASLRDNNESQSNDYVVGFVVGSSTYSNVRLRRLLLAA
jgi:hypothetical protein